MHQRYPMEKARDRQQDRIKDSQRSHCRGRDRSEVADITGKYQYSVFEDQDMPGRVMKHEMKLLRADL